MRAHEMTCVTTIRRWAKANVRESLLNQYTGHLRDAISINLERVGQSLVMINTLRYWELSFTTGMRTTTNDRWYRRDDKWGLGISDSCPTIVTVVASAPGRVNEVVGACGRWTLYFVHIEMSYSLVLYFRIFLILVVTLTKYKVANCCCGSKVTDH